MEISKGVPGEYQSVGLDFWMARVTQECDYARLDFDPEHVHDLRVALRRCRSMADGYMSFDPHAAWKQMKDAGKRLFQRLGALRDTQIMMQWIQRLNPEEDAASATMNRCLADQERRLKESAAQAIGSFSRKKWNSWSKQLGERARRISPESLAFQHLALERWSEVRALHRQALRNRSQVSYHRLRIGLKKFRYTIENFLPSRYEIWGRDLRDLQDFLGEMHDLDVLLQTAVEIGAVQDETIRLEWRQRILEMKNQRLERYREKMLGRTSLLRVWRAELPGSDQIKFAAMARLRTWASFRDPDFSHSEHVAQLALQIHDGLHSLGLIPTPVLPDARFLLQAAAVAHDVGCYKTRKKHHIASYRMIRKLDPPLGWSTETLQQVALIAKYHRGALPSVERKEFDGICEEKQKALILLSGILRLANAFDTGHEKHISRLELKKSGNTLVITAQNYSQIDALAQKLAAARHLLEMACRLPILIR